MSYPLTTQSVPQEVLASSTGAELVPGGLVIAPGQALKAGTAIGQITSAGPTQYMWKAYASGNTDGSQTPLFILAQNVDTTTAGNQNNPSPAAAYLHGCFKKSLLTGVDANALSVRTNWISHTNLDLLWY